MRLHLQALRKDTWPQVAVTAGAGMDNADASSKRDVTCMKKKRPNHAEVDAHTGRSTSAEEKKKEVQII